MWCKSVPPNFPPLLDYDSLAWIYYFWTLASGSKKWIPGQRMLGEWPETPTTVSITRWKLDLCKFCVCLSSQKNSEKTVLLTKHSLWSVKFVAIINRARDRDRMDLSVIRLHNGNIKYKELWMRENNPGENDLMPSFKCKELQIARAKERAMRGARRRGVRREGGRG